MADEHEEWIEKLITSKMRFILDGKRYDVPHVLREAIQTSLESAIRQTLVRTSNGSPKE